MEDKVWVTISGERIQGMEKGLLMLGQNNVRAVALVKDPNVL